MFQSNRNLSGQRGVGVMAVLMIIVVLAVIGGVGYLVVGKNANSTNQGSTITVGPPKSATSASQSKAATPAPAQEPFVNVVQADHSIVQLTPEKASTTVDQAAILTTLHKLSCAGAAGGGLNVTVNNATFSQEAGNTNFKQSGDYAYVNASTCDKAVKSIDGLVASGAMTYLHKANGSWKVDTRTQMNEPACKDVDNVGYPESILAKCRSEATGADAVRKPN